MRDASAPVRVQLQRTKGWKMPPNTVKVDRTSRWGNPWTAANTGMVDPVLRFACETAPFLDLSDLRGKNLACWCRPGASCHADVLLELANEDASQHLSDTREATDGEAVGRPNPTSPTGDPS